MNHMKHIRSFNENKNNTNSDTSDMKVITRSDEQNIIGYRIPGTSDLILGRTPDRLWVVKTSDGLIMYDTNEVEDLYNLDLIESDLERLGWTS